MPIDGQIQDPLSHIIPTIDHLHDHQVDLNSLEIAIEPIRRGIVGQTGVRSLGSISVSNPASDSDLTVGVKRQSLIPKALSPLSSVSLKSSSRPSRVPWPTITLRLGTAELVGTHRSSDSPDSTDTLLSIGFDSIQAELAGVSSPKTNTCDRLRHPIFPTILLNVPTPIIPQSCSRDHHSFRLDFVQLVPSPS